MGFINKILKKFAKQKAVLWERVGAGPSGEAVYEDPVEIDVRWEDKEQAIENSDGTTFVSTAYVMMSVNPKKGSLLYKGALADWRNTPSYPNPPTYSQGGRNVEKVNETPDLKAKEFLYEAYL